METPILASRFERWLGYDEFTLQGAGIAADSDPEMETYETEHKARAVIRAARWAASPEASSDRI